MKFPKSVLDIVNREVATCSDNDVATDRIDAAVSALPEYRSEVVQPLVRAGIYNLACSVKTARSRAIRAQQAAKQALLGPPAPKVYGQPVTSVTNSDIDEAMRKSSLFNTWLW